MPALISRLRGFVGVRNSQALRPTSETLARQRKNWSRGSSRRHRRRHRLNGIERVPLTVRRSIFLDNDSFGEQSVRNRFRFVKERACLRNTLGLLYPWSAFLDWVFTPRIRPAPLRERCWIPVAPQCRARRSP